MLPLYVRRFQSIRKRKEGRKERKKKRKERTVERKEERVVIFPEFNYTSTLNCMPISFLCILFKGSC